MVVERKNSEQAIGRTKTAFIPKPLVDPVAIITEIIAHAVPDDSGKRLDFRGPVKLDDETIRHLETVVLPIVDEFADQTGVPHKNHILSIENIGVTATRGKGLKISGFSADLPLFLALLSATLQLPLRQDVISTGHISSVEEMSHRFWIFRLSLKRPSPLPTYRNLSFRVLKKTNRQFVWPHLNSKMQRTLCFAIKAR